MANLNPRIKRLEKRVGLNSVDALRRRFGTQAMVACLTYCIDRLEGKLENPPDPPPDFNRIMASWGRIEPKILEVLELIRDVGTPA